MDEQKSTESTLTGTMAGTPSRKAQSWGLMISIVVIVLMIVVGAFYAWGERVAQNTPPSSFTQ